jgi:hypothetical protein
MQNEIRLDIKWELVRGIEPDLALFEELGATVGRHFGPGVVSQKEQGEEFLVYDEYASATLYFSDAQKADLFVKYFGRLSWAHRMENNDPSSSRTVVAGGDVVVHVYDDRISYGCRDGSGSIPCDPEHTTDSALALMIQEDLGRVVRVRDLYFA